MSTENNKILSREELLAMAVPENNQENDQENVEIDEISDSDEKNLQETLDKSEELVYNEEDKEESQDFSESEQKARKKGWRPKEEFDGDPETWVDYEEFNRQTPLHEAIKAIKKELKEALKDKDKAIDSLSNILKKRELRQAEQEIAQAKTLRKEAIKSGDEASLNAIDDYIATRTKELESPELKIEEPKPVQQQPKLLPEAEAFIQRNSWWHENTPKAEAMRAYASRRDVELLNQYPNKTHAEIYQIVEKETKNLFSPQGNSATRRNVPPPASEGVTKGTSSGGSTKFGYKDLDSDQKRTYNMLKERGRDADAYISELVENGLINKK